MGEIIRLAPLVLGYARIAPYANHRQFTIVQGKLATYARQAGLMLGTVYFERTDSAPAAFTELLAAIERGRATGVVVPSLTDFGDKQDERIAHLEDVASVVVHAVDSVSVHDPRD